jgi:hypothetical protein
MFGLGDMIYYIDANGKAAAPPNNVAVFTAPYMGRPLRFFEVVDAKVHFQQAVVAAQIPWLGHGAARLQRSRALATDAAPEPARRSA